MTILDVAHHLDVGWDLIKDIQKRDLQRRFAKPKLKHLHALALDEIAIAKGHRYLRVVMDLERGAVVFVGDGKGADALKPFGKRLRPSGAKIAAVAMDMSGAYRAAVATHLPKAKIVFDRFHVIKLFHEKLSDLRRELYREATASGSFRFNASFRRRFSSFSTSRSSGFFSSSHRAPLSTFCCCTSVASR